MTLANVERSYREIPLGLLDPPRMPSRVGMDDAALDELARDLRLKGLLVPLIVARTGARYEIVAGHRRSIAAGRAGLVAVMCCVFPSYETALIGAQFSENRFRTDLSPAEEAILFDELLARDCAGDVDRLCELLGERRSYVENRLNLFRGCRHVFEALLQNKITLGVAQKLNECSDELMRRYFLDAALRGGATVAVAAGWIQQWKLDTGAAATPVPRAPSAGNAAPVPETEYFVCAVCRASDNVHLMRPINVHDYCRLAVLDKLLATYHGEA